jgi:hypothetical protein
LVLAIAIAAWVGERAMRELGVSVYQGPVTGWQRQGSRADAMGVADPRPYPSAVSAVRDLLRVLEEEIRGLPSTYRLPVVLCCLEGLSIEEAGERLGCTSGSIKGRLERGRARLHRQVVRRGLTLAATLATAEMSHAITSTVWSAGMAGLPALALTFAAVHRFRVDPGFNHGCSTGTEGVASYVLEQTERSLRSNGGVGVSGCRRWPAAPGP